MEDHRLNIPRKILIATLIFFFLSGMCGLIYQILWTRILSLLFGHTTFAIGTVITAFMGGLALGSYCFGRWADGEGRLKNLLKKQGGSPHFLAYGLMEAGVGLYCLLTPFLFTLVESAYLQFASLPFYAINILRFVLCTTVLIVPTFLMGGTFPIISKFFIQNFAEFSAKLGRLYFINTFGAAVGSFLAGLYLLRILGLTATLQCAAVINVGIGVLVFMMNKELGTQDAAVMAAGAGGEETPEALEPSAARLIFILFAFTGFASMIYEIAWTRALALALGSSIYAFSTMLTTFLLGIALGSILFSRMAGRRSFSAASFGWLEIITGAFCLLSVFLLGKMPVFFIKIFPFVQGSHDTILLADFLLSFLVMIVPTILMGFVFPLVGRLYTRNMNRLGRSLGNIYAVNTFGCILGSFLTSFVMIPFLGVQNSLKVAVVINILSGIIVLYQAYPQSVKRTAALAAAAATVFLSGFMPNWNPAVMASGAAVYAKIYEHEVLNFDASRKEVLFYKDGISSTVSVHKSGDNVYLRVNGKTDASTAGDKPTQVMLGYLPMIHHRDTRDVFIIGYGSGITAKAVLDFPGVNSVVCAELEPAVLEANQFFAAANHQVMENPRFKVKIEDGRNALLAAKEKYDVIISEPSNPWIAGVANLYTTEFYRIGKARLKEGGIFCQWFHLYSMSPADMKMILKTFYSVFPYGTVWTISVGDIILLGSASEMIFDYARWTRMLSDIPAVKKGMDEMNIQAPDALFAHFLNDAESLRPLLRTAAFNTDNLPILEFSAPLNLYIDTTPMNLKGLLTYKQKNLPPVKGFPADRRMSPHYYVALFNQMNKINAAEMCAKMLEEAMALYPRSDVLQMVRAKTLVLNNQMLKAEGAFRRLLADHPDCYTCFLEAARFYRGQGLPEKAKLMFEKAFRLNPGDENMNEELLRFFIDLKDYDKASGLLQGLRVKNPDNVRYQILSGIVHKEKGDYPEALRLLNEALGKQPGRYDVMRHLFMIYREQGNREKVIEMGAEMMKKNPGDREVLVEYGKTLIAAGQKTTGREVLQRAIRLDPFNSREIENLLAAGQS